jgi:DinB superfamily
MTSNRSLHPRTKELLDYLDSQREALRLAFDKVPPALTEQVPAPGCWSAAGVIEHLAIVEDGVNSKLKRGIQEACQEMLGPEAATDPVLPLLPLDHLFDRSTRVDAREAVSPTGLPSGAAWSALEHAGDALRQTLIAADGFALGTVRMPHARFGIQSAYYFFAFVGAHERRHAAQLYEIAEKLSRNG